MHTESKLLLIGNSDRGCLEGMVITSYISKQVDFINHEHIQTL